LRWRRRLDLRCHRDALGAGPAVKEVSSKVFHIFFKAAAAKGITLEQMVEGTTVSVETLRSKNGRLDWAELCTIHRNLRPAFSDDDLTEIGRSYFRSPALRFVFVIARLRFTPMGFYRWLSKPRQGAGNQMFTCIVPNHRDISETECELELTLPDGYEVCWDFFLISRGNMEEMPRLLGYPSATVTLERIERGARYHITIPKRTRFLTRLRRALTWPFTVRAAARELQEAHETLRDRYAEIDSAHQALDRQRAVLDTAYRFGQRIMSERDPAIIAPAIASSLVDIAGFAGASLEVARADVPEQIERATAGAPTDGDGILQIDLSSRGHLAGGIRIARHAVSDAGEAQIVIDLLAPTIALALDNAFGYRALADYQKNLERLVDQRTTELRQTSDQLAGTVDQLREAQGGRERFFGHISHEIRTPLSLIMLAVSDIERRAGALLDERGRASLGTVNDAARKLVRLVDELLLLAAGQEGKLRLYPEPTDLAALVASLDSAWRPAAEAAGLELITRSPARLVAVVDPVAIERIATNLVSNAVKYTPRGGTVEIELAVVDETDVALSVRDTGPGFGEELGARLFGRFERASGDDRRKAGHGLGLSLVRHLVEAHGGTVVVMSRDPGPGSTLHVAIPDAVYEPPTSAVRPTVDAVATRASIASGTVLTPPGMSAGTILLAEDDARLAEMIARVLADEYTVVIALDGHTALELVEQHQPQLLVTDVDMPGITGIELSRRFREVTNDRLAPIIILSAMIDLGTRVAGLEAGAIDYITKPFDPEELRARVKAQFRMRMLALRLHRAEQLSALGVLTAGLAHEIRNPANGIVNAVAPLIELLPPELTKSDTGTGQLLEVMTGCAEQIAFLSRQLLDFRGGDKLELRGAPVEDLVNRAVSLAHRALHGVEIRAELGLSRVVMCAPPLMIQVLTNLLENAGHAAGEGGWVEIGARTEAGSFLLEVADSGPGVPLALRDRVFEPFFTTKPPGVGTGLGLPLARAIVHQHGGVLEIRDRGTHQHGPRPVFVVELPIDSPRDRRVGAV
jgi:signal transduction histidine kinase